MRNNQILRNSYTAVLVLGSILLSPLNVFAAEEGWFGFRGGSPSRTGQVEEISVGNPLKVVWKYKIEDKSNGFVDWGAVVYKGKIYTPDGLNNILVLNAQDGTLIWKKKLVSNVFSVTMSPDGKILYVTTAITTKPSPTLFALDPETGDILWDNMLNGQPAVGGMEGAPVLNDGVIYAAYLQYEGHGGIAAYEAKGGKLLWHTPMPRFSPYSALSFGDGKIFLGFENKSLYAFDAKTGKIVWQSVQLADLPFSAPVFVDGRVYIGTGNTVYSFDSSNGTILWQKVLEIETGHGALAYFNKTLYGGGRDGKLFALQASEGGLLWIKDLGLGPIESSGLIDGKNKKIYLATQSNKVAAVNITNGEVVSQVTLSDDPRGVWKNSPAVDKGRIYIGSLDRTFYALE